MLSWMASGFFEQSPALAYPVFALGLFIVIFAAVSLRALFTSKAEIARLRALPLDDSEHADAQTKKQDIGPTPMTLTAKGESR